MYINNFIVIITAVINENINVYNDTRIIIHIMLFYEVLRVLQNPNVGYCTFFTPVDSGRRLFWLCTADSLDYHVATKAETRRYRRVRHGRVELRRLGEWSAKLQLTPLRLRMLHYVRADRLWPLTALQQSYHIE